MMGRTHALTGAAVWLAAVPHTSVVGTVAGSLACAGAALLPDLDQTTSTAGRFLGPASGAVAWCVSKVSGGHRCGTHGVLGITAATALAYALSPWTGLGMFLLIALGLRALGLRWAYLPAAAVLAYVAPVPPRWWLPAAVALGVAVHILGDILTTEGVPLLWPRATRSRLPVLGDAGSAREHALGVVALAGIAWLAVS